MKRTLLLSAISLALALFVPPHAHAAKDNTKTIGSSKYDMDGDGKSDRIAVTFSGAEYYNDTDFNFTAAEVIVNGQTAELSGDYLLSKVFIVDIDKKDGRKEILICDNGPSDDPLSYFYGLYDGKLVHLGTLEGHPLYTPSIFKVNGDGTVTSPCRSRLLQTWWYAGTYRLDEQTQLLLPVEKDVYPSVGDYPVKVTRPFKAYSEKDEGAKSISLKKGVSITINGTDEREWIRFQYNGKKTGWIRLEDYAPDESGWWYTDTIKGYGAASDYLQGLEYFD